MSTHITRTGIAAACALIIPATAVGAKGDGQSETVASLSPMVVTATRTAQSADETVAPVTVIDRGEIERSGAATLPDLLDGRAGIDISRSGGFGKSTTVNIRGLGTGKVLYLVNGTRIAAPGSIEGAPSIQYIPTAQIERVEIVRGPRSTLYGSQALGGVINIITRQARETGVQATAGYGSYNSRRGEASLSSQGEKFNYNLSLGGFETDGYDVRDDGFDDDDGFENASVSARTEFAPTERVSLSLDLLRDEGTTEFDNCSDQSDFTAPPSGNCKTDFNQSSVGIEGEMQMSGGWTSRVRLSRNREERRNFYAGDFNNEFDGTSTTVSWQNDVTLGDAHLLSIGLDATRDQVDQPNGFEEDERDRSAVFAQWQTHAGAHDVVFGLRGIDDGQFGSKTVGSLDYGIQLADGLRALASAGTAFKAPSLFQLYSPRFGNDELEPEESTTLELGLAGNTGWGRWSVRGYRTEVENLIDFVSSPTGYDNVSDEVQIDGLEVEISGRIRGWDAGLSYSWSEPVDQSTGNVLPNRAERSFRLSLERGFGVWRAGGEVVAQSERTGGAFSDTVPGYGIMNLQASRRFGAEWRLRTTMENVFDIDYQTNDQYRGAGRTAFVYIDYRPGNGS